MRRIKSPLVRWTVVSSLVVGFTIALIVSCTQNEATAKPNLIFKDSVKPGIVAKVGDAEVTEEELIGDARLSYYEIKKKEYDFKMDRLNAVLTNKLLSKEAAAAKLSLDDYIEKKIVGGKITPTEKDFKGFLKERQVTEDQVTPQLKERVMSFLIEQKRDEKVNTHVAKITKSNPIEVYFKKPKLGIDIQLAGAPVWGNAKAPVTIVEFSDFQCPFCSRAAATMAEVKKKFGSKIKVAFKHFPLSFHKDAKPASEASMCVHEQDSAKFWKFYSVAFENQKNLDSESLDKYAKDVGVNMEKYKACRAAGKYTKQIEDDVAYGEKIGVRSTPTFFINGELISGAVPPEKFAEAIEAALAEPKS